MAVALPAGVDEKKLLETWKKRISSARDYRKQLEPTWLSNLAFAAGQHWLVWDPDQRKMRHIAEVDPRYADRELYTADKLNEQLQAQMGELESDDDRPELLLAQEGDSAEQQQRELNECAAHGWDYEWAADSALTQARRLCLKLGTAAIRVVFDPNRGGPAGHVPIHPATGQPVLDQESLQALEQTGALPDGSLPVFKPVREGRTSWQPLSALNLLTPPGVNHEDSFPWEVIVRPVLLDSLVEEYGDVAAGLVEDSDIASVIGLSTTQITRTGGSQADKGRLRDHGWLFTCFERPCRTYPNGQVVHIATNEMRLLRVDPELPIETVEGEYRTGVHYFHWWRLDDRFFSRSMIEPMKDPQRLTNEVATGSIEIMRRGYPKVFVKEGALVENPAGLPLEVVELSDTALEPHFFAGIGPGDWMFKLKAEAADDLAHASTLSALRLGQNPTNVNTYAQLALLNENEAGKRSTILGEHKLSIAHALEDSMHFVRKYWPESKKILVSGDEGAIQQKVFSKSKIPDFFVVKSGRGSARPRSQGAELTKIDAIWKAATEAGLTTGPNGAKWVDWYTRSLDAGQALDLPIEEADSQADLAHFENFLMRQGETPVPAEHDVMPVHIPVHREELDQARAAEDHELAARILQHIDESIQIATMARKQWRAIDPADLTDTASDLALDEDQALRENKMLLDGEPLNPEEYKKAYASLQRGINPETGQQVQLDPQTHQVTDDIHGILERAALKPTLIENLQMHLDRHGKVIKSAAFRDYSEDARRRFFEHFQQTRELYLSLPLLPDKMTPPHVTLSLREDVGATTTAQILRRAGVPEADPETIKSEPPLESDLRVVDTIKDLLPPANENSLTADDAPGAQPAGDDANPPQ